MKTLSSAAVALSFLVGVSALAQVASPQPRAATVGHPHWSPQRPGFQPTIAAQENRLSSPAWNADSPTPVGVDQTGVTAPAENSPTLNWRAPKLRGDEMPRRLPPARTPVGSVATRTSGGTDKRVATRPTGGQSPAMNADELIRLVSQIEELEFPSATQKTATAADAALQLPYGRDAFASPESSLPAAPSPDDLITERAAGAARTQPTVQQLPAGSEDLFSDGDAVAPDLGVLNFDDQPPAPTMDEPRSRYQAETPEVAPDSPLLPPLAAEDAGDTPAPDDANPSQLEALPDPPGLSAPPDFSTGALRMDQQDDGASRGAGGSKFDLGEFDGRDCAAENAQCDTARDILDRIERSRVSVDITPSILPLEVDMAKVIETRDERLAKAPVRTWRDRSGKVLLEGNLTDFRQGEVHVRAKDGSVQMIPPSKLSEEDWCFVTAWWDIPTECRFKNEAYAMRDFRLTTFTWTADATCHKPLYFEEVYLERSGHTAGPLVQPFISGAHFFGNVAMLPYHMGLNPPNECLYTLGHYRPGECAPWFVGGFPMSTRGIKWEGFAWAAAIALLP